MSNRTTGVMALVLAIGFAACAESAAVEPATEAPESAVVEPTTAPESEEPTEAKGADVESVFTLNPELSEARFIIGEILANQPNTVIGVNNQVQGGGALNFAEPTLSTLYEFLIDSSRFETDSSMRNRAIRQFILQSDQYPVISFQPTGIVGMPTEIVAGETVSFEVIGLLTIQEITQEVTFAGEATMVTDDRVEGFATATVLRSDFELTIPSVPRVAGVDEEVILEIEFVAVAG